MERRASSAAAEDSWYVPGEGGSAGAAEPVFRRRRLVLRLSELGDGGCAPASRKSADVVDIVAEEDRLLAALGLEACIRVAVGAPA